MNQTFLQYAEAFVEQKRKQGLPVSKCYATYLTYLIPSVAEKRLTDIERGDIRDLQVSMQVLDFANSTINQTIHFCKRVLVAAGEDYDEVRVPSFRNLCLPETKKLRYLMDGEENRLLENLTGFHYDLAVFLIDTGCRIGEALGVKYSDISNDWREINIYRPKTDIETIIPVSNRLCMLLKKRRLKNQGSYVFSSCMGDKPASYSMRPFMKAVEKAGLNNADKVKRYGRFTPHSLRHSFASRLRQSGMELDEVRHLLGHKDIKTTLIYAHLVPSDTANKAVNIINKINEENYGFTKGTTRTGTGSVSATDSTRTGDDSGRNIKISAGGV